MREVSELGVFELMGLLSDAFRYVWMGMAMEVYPPRAHGIDVGSPLNVEKKRSFSSNDRDGVSVDLGWDKGMPDVAMIQLSQLMHGAGLAQNVRAAERNPPHRPPCPTKLFNVRRKVWSGHLWPRRRLEDRRRCGRRSG